MIIIEYSNWPERLRRAALDLIKHEGLWNFDEEHQKLSLCNDIESLDSVVRLKVVGSVALEFLTKALCLSRQIDILKQQNQSVRNNSPYKIFGVTSAGNQWLLGRFATHSVSSIADLCTVSFSECIQALRSDLSLTELLNDLDDWRSVHRNVDCHFSHDLTITAEYEHRLTNLLNGLLAAR